MPGLCVALDHEDHRVASRETGTRFEVTCVTPLEPHPCALRYQVMDIAAAIVLSAIDLGVVLIVFAMLLWAAVQDGRTTRL